MLALRQRPVARLTMLFVLAYLALMCGLVGTARAQDSNPTPAPGGATIHVVQRGETLFGIAQKYGATVDAIARANGLTDPSQLQVGQRLLIPNTSAVIPTSEGPVSPTQP